MRITTRVDREGFGTVLIIEQHDYPDHDAPVTIWAYASHIDGPLGHNAKELWLALGGEDVWTKHGIKEQPERLTIGRKWQIDEEQGAFRPVEGST